MYRRIKTRGKIHGTLVEIIESKLNVMKKVIASILVSLFTVGVFACSVSSLTVKAPSYSNFTVILDNKKFQSKTNTLKIENLEIGKHHLKIIVNRANGKYWSSEEVYNGYFNTTMGTKVVARVGPNNATEIKLLANHHKTKRTKSVNGYGTCSKKSNMNTQEFLNLKTTISETSFDNTKYKIAKQAIYGNTISSVQITEIMQLFSFERTKLDLAKYAYRYVVDQQNYYLVNTAFDFNSSTVKLSEYLAVI